MRHHSRGAAALTPRGKHANPTTLEALVPLVVPYWHFFCIDIGVGIPQIAEDFCHF